MSGILMVKPVRAKKASFAIVVLWGQEASKGVQGRFMDTV